MSFIDHVRCGQCSAYFHPEAIVSKRGGPSCPKCGGELNMMDMFGVNDAFVGIDDESGNDVSLDELIPQSTGAPSPRAVPESHRIPISEGAQSVLDLMKDIKKS